MTVDENTPPDWFDEIPSAGSLDEYGPAIEKSQKANFDRDDKIKLFFPSSVSSDVILPRRWLVTDLIPTGHVTALYGDGGVGKSLLAQQLATCCATGRDFLGMQIGRIKVLGVFCEDSNEELVRRQNEINAALGTSFVELENLSWISRLGFDSTLMNFLNEARGTETSFFNDLLRSAREFGARLLIVDTAADTFGGNEILRSQVRQFINLLTRIAVELDGAVLLCAHPSQSGLREGTGTSGSTAWNNSVRSRLYLRRPSRNEIEELRENQVRDLRILSVEKSNYSEAGNTIVVKWEAGAFRSVGGSPRQVFSQTEKTRTDAEDDALFLRCLDERSKQGRRVSEAKQAPNYAPKVFLRMGDFASITRPRFERAMERLFERGAIEVGEVGRGSDRKRQYGIRRKQT